MTQTPQAAGAAVLVAALALAGPALAHHPLGGAPMTTFAQGLLSGIGHPILGFDHLFFVVAAGLAARFTRWPLLAPAAYLVTMAAGVGLVAGGAALPLVEPLVLASLLVAGGALAAARRLPLAVFAGFGLFHGAAFGSAIAGQEGASAGVLGGYLAGLVAAQWAIAVLAGLVAERRFRIAAPEATGARLAGAAIAGAGLVLALEAGDDAALAALGLG